MSARLRKYVPENERQYSSNFGGYGKTAFSQSCGFIFDMLNSILKYVMVELVI